MPNDDIAIVPPIRFVPYAVRQAQAVAGPGALDRLRRAQSGANPSARPASTLYPKPTPGVGLYAG